jgi:hypothetical protein
MKWCAADDACCYCNASVGTSFVSWYHQGLVLGHAHVFLLHHDADRVVAGAGCRQLRWSPLVLGCNRRTCCLAHIDAR